MKKTTLNGRILLLIFAMSFVSTQLFAGNINVKSGSTELKLTKSTYQEIELTNILTDLEFTRVKTQAGYFTLLTAEDYGYSTVKGEPRLPVIKELIEVPLVADYQIEIISQSFTDVDLNAHGIADYIIPAQAPLSKNIDNPEDVEFIFNQDSYNQNTLLGQEMIQVVDLGIIRGVKMARVEIAPVFYNPVSNQIRVYTDLKLRVKFNNANIAQTVDAKETAYSPFYQAIYNQMINFKPIDGAEFITAEPVTYIIVSDPEFESDLQPFIEWKTMKGFQVVEAYTDNPEVGTTTTSIKNYLQDFYNNPPEGYNPQSFVLIVGDIAEVPTFSGTAGGHVTDLYYFTYDGAGDIYPECFYGRFSASTLSQLQPQIDKTLEYEKYEFPDPSFLDEVVMVAGADGSYATVWGNGQINYGTENYFNAAHGILSHTYLQPEPTGGNYSQNIRNDINNGIAFGNYTAHCSASGWADPSFVINHIAQLTNAHKYPLLIGNCCSSVEFQTTCFGEEILRAADKGALGYVGGSNSTYWDEDYWFGVGYRSNIVANPTYNANNLGAYDRMFHDHGEPLDDWYITQGQVPSAGNLAVTQSGSSMETYYWEIYHLMGDPSVMIYLSQPPATYASYQALMPLSSNTFTVNTEPHAYVAISKDGELNGCALADATGLAEVDMFNPIVVPGEADVVITGQNLMPFIGTVTVASPNGAYVLFDDLEIDDSNGNNNGVADFSEEIMLNISLENLGSLTASNLTATISTDDENVSIVSDTHAWPDIAAGDASMEYAAFTFTINELIPDQHIVNFDMEITDGVDVWNSTFNITLNAPVLIIGSYTIDDGTGNNNGRLDPGETANIIVPNFNEGGCDALSTVAALVSTNPMITVNNATFDLQTIAAGGTVNAIFNITVDPMAQVGEIVSLNYNVESAPYSQSSILGLTIGLIVEDFETGTFEMFEWDLGGDADWQITSSGAYEGEYAAKSGTITHNQVSTMSLTVDISTDDQISFFYKVSSESNYDYLNFYIDNVLKDGWSGDVDWTEIAYDVTAGTHTFKWEYSKDYSVSSGSDCAWVDFIVFPPLAGLSPLGVMTAANPVEICSGESTQLNAYAMGGSGEYTYDWMPEESLNDPNIANPIATPAVTTTYYVVVDDGETSVTGEITVVVNAIPEQPTISQNGAVLVSSSSDGNQWYDSNGMIPGANAQSYTPTSTDNYYVIVTSGAGCESEPSDSYYFIYTGLIEFKEDQKVNIYPNPYGEQFTLDYTLSSRSDVHVYLYNSFGQMLSVIEEDNSKLAGNYRLLIDASRYNTGIYYLKIETNDYSVIRRLIQTK
ncbi:MAG: T9SS type A sorting domain-containing protein [Bacteroidales bacterium]|nr:T9SS type A sorting domain-containing protein [Bacteroidales bacterium]